MRGCVRVGSCNESRVGLVKLARRIWASCVLITLCMGSFGPGGLMLGFAVSLLVSIAAIEPALLLQRFVRLPMLLAAALYLGWTLLSLAWAEPGAYLPLLSRWSNWLVLLSAAGCMMTGEVRQGLWRAFLAVQVIVALWAVYVALDCIVELGAEARAQACMSPRLPHGSVVCAWMLSVAALVALVWLEGRARMLVTGVLLLAILLIAEPVAWIVALLGLAIALPAVQKLAIPRVVLAGGIVSAMLAVLLVLPAERAQFSALMGSGTEATETRLEAGNAWRTGFEAAVPAIARSPFVGHGMGAWSELRPIQREEESGREEEGASKVAGPLKAPNSYIEVLVEYGFIGLLLFLGALFSLWQAAAWLGGWEATATRSLVVMMSAGCLFQPWATDPSATRLFLLLLLLLLSGLRAPVAAAPAKKPLQGKLS